MDNNIWDNLSKNEAYQRVLSKTKALLDQASNTYSTAQIIEQLYPASQAIYARQQDQRQQLFKALLWYAKHDLQAYCSKGAATGKFMGHDKRPWIWHKPKEMEYCPMCGHAK